MRGLCIAALACGLPMAAAAEQTEEALFAVLAERGCSVGPQEVADTFGPEGFTPEFVRETLTGLLLDGTATEDAMGRLSVPPSLCPPEGTAMTPKDQLVAEFARNDCTLDARQVPDITAKTGLAEAQLQAIIQPLYDSGAVSVVGRRAILTDRLCRAAAIN